VPKIFVRYNRPKLNVVGRFWAHKLLSNSFFEKFLLVLKIHTKKSAKQENSSLFVDSM
jgi:hypothetical protein